MLALTVVSSFALALSGAVVPADTTAPPKTMRAPSWSVGGAYLRFGTTRLGVGALNDVLTRNGRPAFAEAASMAGFSAHARFGRLMLGATGETSLPHRRVAGGWFSQLSAGLATFDAGVAVYQSHGTLVAPMASIGVRRTGLRLEQQGEFTYDDGVAHPARGVTLSSRSGVTQAGLLLEQRFRAPRVGQLAVSAQVGVSAPFGGASTFAGENRVGQSPTLQSGGYARIAIGKPIARRGEALNSAFVALLSMISR